MSELRSREQAMAAAVARSTDPRHQQRCRRALLTPLVTSMHQLVCSRPSTWKAHGHASRMQTSAVGQQQHACTSTAAMRDDGAAIHPGVPRMGHPSIPRSRSTSAAISQQRVGVFRPDKVSTTLRAKGSNAMTLSMSVADMCKFDVFLNLLPDFGNPPL